MFDSNSIVDSLYYYKEVYLMSLVVLPKMKTAVLSGANIVNYSTSEHLETVERYRGVLFDESTHRSASESAKRDLDSVILQSREWKRGTGHGDEETRERSEGARGEPAAQPPPRLRPRPPLHGFPVSTM